MVTTHCLSTDLCDAVRLSKTPNALVSTIFLSIVWSLTYLLRWRSRGRSSAASAAVVCQSCRRRRRRLLKFKISPSGGARGADGRAKRVLIRQFGNNSAARTSKLLFLRKEEKKDDDEEEEDENESLLKKASIAFSCSQAIVVFS